MYTTIKNDKGEIIFYGSNFDLWDEYINHISYISYADHEDKKTGGTRNIETFALALACIADGNMRGASHWISRALGVNLTVSRSVITGQEYTSNIFGEEE